MRELDLDLEVFGRHAPKTKAEALRLLGLSYADINKRINAKKGKLRFLEATEDAPQAAYIYKELWLRYRDRVWDFSLTATKIIQLDSVSELPLTFLSGSKTPEEKRTISEEEFFTIQEAADKLKVNYATIRKLIKKGELEAAKVGGLWRITGTGIKNLMKGDSDND